MSPLARPPRPVADPAPAGAAIAAGRAGRPDAAAGNHEVAFVE